MAPNYEWVVRDAKTQSEYQKGFSVIDLFQISSVGIVTSRDNFVIELDKRKLAKRIQDFLVCQSPQEALSKFNLKENKQWKVAQVLKHSFDESNIIPVSYRPFDDRFVYYHADFIERSRERVMKNFLNDNVALVALRQVKAGETYQHVLVSKHVTESTLISNKTSEIDYIFPLYLYTDDGLRVPNLKKEIVDEIKKIVGVATPEDILDYIYAVLHSPTYREKYKEFLKIDFPRVPYPKDKKTFNKLIAFGKELRELHLLESPKVNNFITTYPEAGSDIVEKKYLKFKDEKVYINETQYFGNVKETVWNFYIGGYQPAQKWLKDRKDRKLSNTDIEHYQKMIVVLSETDRIMKEIDKIIPM